MVILGQYYSFQIGDRTGECIIADGYKRCRQFDTVYACIGDRILSHNIDIPECLRPDGFNSRCIVELNPFDYRTEERRVAYISKGIGHDPTICGNTKMSKRRCPIECIVFYPIQMSTRFESNQGRAVLESRGTDVGQIITKVDCG